MYKLKNILLKTPHHYTTEKVNGRFVSKRENKSKHATKFLRLTLFGNVSDFQSTPWQSLVATWIWHVAIMLNLLIKRT
jgi:hypothetical protein